MLKPEKHVFVCTSTRPNGQVKGFCSSKNAAGIIQNFIEGIEENELQDTVMVSNTGCMGICSQGPIVIIYPDGVWYKEVSPDDVEEIIESHLINGVPVERLLIK